MLYDYVENNMHIWVTVRGKEKIQINISVDVFLTNSRLLLSSVCKEVLVLIREPGSACTLKLELSELWGRGRGLGCESFILLVGNLILHE